MSHTVLEIRLLAGRSLRHIPRVPEKLADVTIQPVIFILLFAYVFGSQIHVLGGGNYRAYLIPGIFAQSMVATLMGLSVGVATDVRSGLIDRLRALPIARVSVLAGRVLAELAQVVLGLVTLTILGLAVGWAPHGNVGETAAAYGLLMLSACAMTWAGTLIGLLVRDPATAITITFTSVFPLMFLSATYVSVGALPTPLRQIAEWNPISAIGMAMRQLFHSPHGAPPDVWPLRHPILASVLWSAVLVAVFAPLAVRRFRRMGS